ncbi:glycerol kinase-like [Ylistrum balloti]|uniref:glycerol kinase-like n=1 Tax=Ylistrum balloti TaxID=509963 RepID=UPI002905C24B|nr:glycerol kinase-like [Ylistrum balloti]
MTTFERYGHLVASIDQGSSSTRFSVFSSKTGEMLAYHQEESVILTPHERWSEMDAAWLIDSTCDCMERTANKLDDMGIHIKDIKCIGITNQMLTLILWDKVTGKSLCNAIGYTDSRAHARYQELERNMSKEDRVKYQHLNGNEREGTDQPQHRRSDETLKRVHVYRVTQALTGSTELKNLYEGEGADELQHRCSDDTLNRVHVCSTVVRMRRCDTVAQCFGIGKSTVIKVLKSGIAMQKLGVLSEDMADIIQEATPFMASCYGTLTGGPNGGSYVTDVTNACHTGLMNLNTLCWDVDICRTFNVPTSILPDIHSTSEVYGYVNEGSFKGIPLSGMAGDQPAATIGQLCFKPGESKCTYGTVASLNINTGTKLVISSHGLLTSPLYQLGKGNPAVYMLEGVVASCGSVIKWIRDNLGMISKASEIEELAGSVEDSDDCYFVPALEGFFCPYWTDDARGVICGLNTNTTKAHICRAALESICFQVRKLLEIAAEESGFPIPSLKADGGMVVNTLFMQMQADILEGNVVRPFMKETTSFGAALMAGSAAGIDIFRINEDHLGLEEEFPKRNDVFEKSCSAEALRKRLKRWEKAVKKSFDWMTE